MSKTVLEIFIRVLRLKNSFKRRLTYFYGDFKTLEIVLEVFTWF